ncbi:Leucyl/phenylalanyl-tRNA--protein transferase [Thalassoporum mexicanum PCC 7367]|uniref:leucyl/phenylalanyl-tRNA--protein transferase n=1 Tax=Thalassoporum mexicanum TaxID=3457544 RepID=UPI00029FBEDB|nr:Leucyl/phenylalanyl-tRNA--protein transferase [Pseudanabaena sp. PCC 7367]
MFDVRSVINGYAQGHFLMAEEEGVPVEWYYTKSRTLIPLDDRFRYPRSLRRAINKDQFQVKINAAFGAVVDGCADRQTTWISDQLKAIYHELNRAGWAYSFETWCGEELAGGILGISIGGAFIGESMFFRVSDGSKVAMVKLVDHLRSRGFLLFDAQLMNPHLQRFGAYEVSDSEYRRMLDIALQMPCSML